MRNKKQGAKGNKNGNAEHRRAGEPEPEIAASPFDYAPLDKLGTGWFIWFF